MHLHIVLFDYFWTESISVHVHTYNFQWAKNPVPYKHCPFEGLKNAYIAQKTHCKYYISKIKKNTYAYSQKV